MSDVTDLKAEVLLLRRENTELRDEIKHLLIKRQHTEDMNTELREQNAKLRELASGYEALTATLCNERECDGCPLDDPEQIVCEHMRLQTCLAELEIEVDE